MACIKVAVSVCVALLFARLVDSTPTVTSFQFIKDFNIRVAFNFVQTEKPKAMTADDDYEQALEYVAECKKDLKLTDGIFN
jgi:hypothetical protein